ncbi:hypothetical protein MBLNU13_g02609t1 [Cladosporium sp. NU13]
MFGRSAQIDFGANLQECQSQVEFAASVYWKHFLGFFVAKADLMVATSMRSRPIVGLFDWWTSNEEGSPPRDGMPSKQSASRLSASRLSAVHPPSSLFQNFGMNLALGLSPHLLSTLCYTLSYEERNDDSRRFRIVGVYKRAAHAVAALRRLRLLIHSAPVAAVDEEGVEFPNGNQIGLLRDPEDPQNRLIGWWYRFRQSGTDDVSTIWIKQAFMMREVAGYALLRPTEIVNWRHLVEESRIRISDDTLHGNGHANLDESNHGFVEERDQGGDVMESIWED